MENVLANLSIKISDHLYLKNPESSQLGKNIVSGSIDLIDEIGFENFNFRKLANSIQSTEASIYRYFESKQKVLLYLSSWYWSWLEYRLVFSITNIPTAEEKLKIAIRLLTEKQAINSTFSHINEQKLHQIVISESLKSYLSRQVDEVNKDGAFLAYKNLVERLSNLVLEINPNFCYPRMLITTVIEGGHIQRHFADHLPRLTDTIKGEDSIHLFYERIVFNALNQDQKPKK